MIFYIKDKETFKTKHIEPTETYKLVVGSSTNDNSDVSIKRNKIISKGDIIFNNDGYVGLIEKVDNSDELCRLSIKQIDYIFNRSVIDDGARPTNSIEAYLKTELDKHFTNCSDAKFKIPYLNIIVGSNTNEESAPEVDSKRCVNYHDYLDKVKRVYGIRCNFSVDGNTLKCEIKANTNVKNLIFQNFPYHITEESVTETIVSKVTAISNESLNKNDDGSWKTAIAYTNYYLLEDGSVSTNASAANRVIGDWEYITYSKDDKPLEKAKDTFEKNKYEHKIIFTSPKAYAVYDYGDKLKMLLNGKIYNTYISKKTISSDGTIEYQVGDLAITLTDILKLRRI